MINETILGICTAFVFFFYFNNITEKNTSAPSIIIILFYVLVLVVGFWFFIKSLLTSTFSFLVFNSVTLVMFTVVYFMYYKLTKHD